MKNPLPWNELRTRLRQRMDIDLDMTWAKSNYTFDSVILLCSSLVVDLFCTIETISAPHANSKLTITSTTSLQLLLVLLLLLLLCWSSSTSRLIFIFLKKNWAAKFRTVLRLNPSWIGWNNKVCRGDAAAWWTGNQEVRRYLSERRRKMLLKLHNLENKTTGKSTRRVLMNMSLANRVFIGLTVSQSLSSAKVLH